MPRKETWMNVELADYAVSAAMCNSVEQDLGLLYCC